MEVSSIIAHCSLEKKVRYIFIANIGIFFHQNPKPKTMAPSSSMRNMIFLIAVLYLVTIASLHIIGSEDSTPLSKSTSPNNVIKSNNLPPSVANHEIPSSPVQPSSSHEVGKIESMQIHNAGFNNVVSDHRLYQPDIDAGMKETMLSPVIEESGQHETVLVQPDQKRGKVAYAVTITRDGP